MNLMPDANLNGRYPAWFGIFHRFLSHIRFGQIDIELPDGRRVCCVGDHDGPCGLIKVHDNRFFWRIVKDGELGFAESYMDGLWSTPDLQNLLDAFLINNDAFRENVPGMRLIRQLERFGHWLRRNTPRQARKNIAHHYDLGNDFYRQWLDPSMTYSSALFESDRDTLQTAQDRKYALICDKIGVRPDHHVLEIGCGWGGFAEYAAKTRGARVTGLTISPAQHDYASRRIFEAGLNERVSISLRDYRDEAGQYDGIASIEMFEAVGEKYWPLYFDSVRERLRPGAQAGLQVITIADKLFDSYRRSVDFIQKYIFPGGLLPSQAALVQQTRRAGLQMGDVTQFGQSYSETLRRWAQSFTEDWDRIRGYGFDDRFFRLWTFYLASCAACFRYRTTDVIQFSLSRPA